MSRILLRQSAANHTHAAPVVIMLTAGAGLAMLLQPPETAATAADIVPTARLPVPDSAALAKAEKLVRDAFGNYVPFPSGSVQRQGLRAANNVANFLKGDGDYVQANPF